MIESITLRNWKSFGEEVRVPLAPITLCVGPNDSGKSNFLSVGRFVSNLVKDRPASAVSAEMGVENLFHRALAMESTVGITWQLVNQHVYSIELCRISGGVLSEIREELSAFGKPLFRLTPLGGGVMVPIFDSLTANKRTTEALSVLRPLVESRRLVLSTEALRSPTEIIAEPELASDGSGLAGIVANMRGQHIEKMKLVDEFVRSCVPSVKYVLAGACVGDPPGTVRLAYERDDGERFDARVMSDGLLCFIALVVFAIDAPPGAVLFIEEPEQAIHPPRIKQLVKLLRQIQEQRECQFVIATHSPTLVDKFLDEPEAILRFRSTPTGTRVERLSDIPELMEALQERATIQARPTPGDLIESNLFNLIASGSTP